MAAVARLVSKHNYDAILPIARKEKVLTLLNNAVD